MTLVMQVLQEQGKYEEVKHLASILYDPNKDEADRLLAAIQISELVADPLLEAMKRDVSPVEEKPKFRWVNGAKVRVK